MSTKTIDEHVCTLNWCLHPNESPCTSGSPSGPAGQRRKDFSAQHRGRGDKKVFLPTKLMKMIASSRESKNWIISLGLQKVVLIRQNMIVQSVLLGQETQSGYPDLPVFCNIMGFLNIREKTELLFSLLLCTVIPSSSTVHLLSVIHYPTEMGEIWLRFPQLPAPPQECRHTMSQHCIPSTAMDHRKKVFEGSSTAHRVGHNSRRMLNKHSLWYKPAMRPRLLGHNITQIHGCQTLLSRQVNGIQGHL